MNFTKAETAALPPLNAQWVERKNQWLSPCCKAYLAHSTDGENLIFRHFIRDEKTKIIFKPKNGIRNWRNHDEYRRVIKSINATYGTEPTDNPVVQLTRDVFLHRGTAGTYQDEDKITCVGLLKSHLPATVICPRCSRRAIISSVKGAK